jgi:hypothetical protein
MPGASPYRTSRRLPSNGRVFAVRLVALAALLLAACIVAAVLLEASEPSPRISAPGIQPLPRALFIP